MGGASIALLTISAIQTQSWIHDLGLCSSLPSRSASFAGSRSRPHAGWNPL